MVLRDPGAPSSDTRPFEEIVADLRILTQELIHTAGPLALNEATTAGPSGIGPRLAAASPELRALCVQLDVLRMTWLPRIESDGLWALDGSRTFRTWLARREKVTLRTASREVLTAERLLAHLPATLTAALEGRIGMDQVRAMVDVGPTSEERRRALAAPIDPAPIDPDPVPTGDVAGADGAGADTGIDGAEDGEGDAVDGGAPGDGAPGDGTSDGGPAGDVSDAGASPSGASGPTGEEVLLDLADQHGPLMFRRLVDRFAQVADPDADERGYKVASDREHLDVAKTFGGYHVHGFLTDEHGEALRAAMDSVMGAPTPGDDRSPTQRRAQALADLARTVLDNGRTGSGASVRPHVTVTVSWTELNRLTTRFAPGSSVTVGGTSTTGSKVGEAVLFDRSTGPAGAGSPLTDVTAAPPRFGISGSLVPTATLRRLLCDSAVTRVVFGADGQVLDVGRAQRTVTGQMRRAVIARDRHCVYPDCTQPPARCEVHHAERHWAQGGSTSVSNSALLCWHHHDLVDTTGIAMRWTGNPDGARHSGWTLTDRHGREIRPMGRSSRATLTERSA
ncbi:DUF222 domain-containing protein [Promicromonospora thailandica]|uniref:HNH nuclease domain-containing protein n=1 Tax=Promicromonospora thailandica TaxID=765201 RepID=A0A9X2G5C0_9MICO|nr:HNH endonuclease signature motif containing protein [Promicromonospora thailandica]MCP2266000.1 protein of unknown function (DUF222) [Promicromonospora thailandica]BFF21415.1 hypothetical protein GCM10025730_49360 [Promicromonospora thailandica]